MNVLKIVEEIGYGAVNIGVEEVVWGCLNAACPTGNLCGRAKVIQEVGKYAIGVATAKKVTEAIREDHEELKETLREKLKIKKEKVQD